MNELKGQPGELRFTVTIKRAATGKEETYNMVGAATPEQIKRLVDAPDGTKTPVTNETKEQ
jgi:hypothetical protein